MRLPTTLRFRTCLAVAVFFGVVFPLRAQDGAGTDLIRDSAVFLRDTGFSAVGSLRNAVEFKACLGIRESVQVNDQDELWLVDARSSHSCPSDLSRVNVAKLENGNWIPSTLDNLAFDHLTDTSKDTVVFIHGDLTDDRWSLTRGAQVYRNLFKNCLNRRPVRLVIWQWKSERACSGFVRDFYVKSARSKKLGTTLALTLDTFHDRNVTVIGYSLGAQIALSAMQQNHPLPVTGEHGYRVALIAPALDCDFTTRAASSPPVGSLIDRIEIFYNSTDRVLKFHDRICEKKFGRNYVPLQQFMQMQMMSLGQVYQCDVGNEVGKTHCIVRYSSSPTVQAEINRLIASGSEHRALEINLGQNIGKQLERANEFFIDDPLEHLDRALDSTQAYLFDPVGRP